MQKLLQSVRTRPINAILIGTAVALYLINNKFIKPNTDGMLHIFFVSYFNDLLCPLFFLGYSNMLLITNNKELTRLIVLLIVCLSAGCVWEFVAPFLKRGSVTDFFDLVCYAVGTTGYWLLLKMSIKKDSTE